MRRRILVINPNSNDSVTAAIERTVARLRFSDGPQINCVTLKEGPFGIETARQADEVVAPLCDLIMRNNTDVDAYVIACFSDPGVIAAREMTSKPVFGLCEAGVAAALNFGERYGILTNLVTDTDAELRLLRAQGLTERLIGIEAIGITVPNLVDSPQVRNSIAEATRKLDERGASAVVLACAGMTAFARDLQREVAVRVIDPVIAATSLAIGAVA